MCEFPSWYALPDGHAVFLTDSDIDNPALPHELGADITGHSAIRMVYPGVEAQGAAGEGFPCHPEVAEAIRAGKMARIMHSAGYAAVHVNAKGELHREDGPAVEWSDGTREWYLSGLIHREDGPAVEQSDGARGYYRNGRPHREDGPAWEWADGTREWWLNGERYDTETAWRRAVRRLHRGGEA